jgi:hypothetical protein
MTSNGLCCVTGDSTVVLMLSRNEREKDKQSAARFALFLFLPS